MTGDEELLNALVRQAQLGDDTAFAALVAARHRQAYQTAYAILHSPRDAEEVTQDAFLKVFRKLHTLKEPSAFSAWLTTIVTRLAIDHMRSQKRHQAEPIENVAEIPERENDPTLRTVIEEALAQLSPDHRAILLLRERDGYEYTEIARILGVPIGTVKSRLAYAKQALRKFL
ncbi:RNA polymerase sigma factor [Sulfoacidibacillus thermotolerans]|uniref:RNA polymerase sigma factor n=1 Tax=Sulfoacidibacillus thermotolerans TaxID=1765684 RepID=A0A2U3D6F5_SULT2|nr:RNA polymerase sigma factor [Sulfoacidibacillus thermotolerans]PWI56860.1 hypothetical protein BM613_11515 [Sulfoacidibacillus thermotolerans]